MYGVGKKSAACFINTPEEIYDIQNNLKNWGVTYPYNVKSIIRNMIYDWRKKYEKKNIKFVYYLFYFYIL